MYGMHPAPGALLPEGFKHALTWKAGITSVKMIPGGRGISYGHRYVTHGTEQRVGVIPVGYADGYRRVPGNRVLVHGQIVPVMPGSGLRSRMMRSASSGSPVSMACR